MVKRYTTVQGDMWDSVAYKTMGRVNFTDRLMMANRQYLNLYTFPADLTNIQLNPAPPAKTCGFPMIPPSQVSSFQLWRWKSMSRNLEYPCGFV